jgi:hypothetical protein
VDVQGKPVEDKSLEITSPPNLIPAYNNSITGTGDVLKSLRQGFNKQIKPDLECPSCQELYAEVTELREALNNTTTLQTADNILTSSSSSISPIIENQVDTVDFEFPLIFGKVGDGGKVWFSGRICTKTGRVISARTGKIDQQNDLADFIK